jgi:hypothetical protein
MVNSAYNNNSNLFGYYDKYMYILNIWNKKRSFHKRTRLT